MFSVSSLTAILMTLVLVTFVLLMAKNVRSPKLAKYKNFNSAFFVLMVIDSFFQTFVKYHWHPSVLNIGLHIVLGLIDLAFSIGGSLVLSQDIDPQDGVIRIQRGSLTYNALKLLDVPMSGQSLCKISWTAVLLLLFVPVASVALGLVSSTWFVIAFLLSGDNPKEMIKVMRKRRSSFAEICPAMFTVKGLPIPRSPVLWLAVALMIRACFGSSRGLVLVGLGAVVALFLLLWGVSELLTVLTNKHAAHEGYEFSYRTPENFSADPIGFASTLFSTVKKEICPRIELQDSPSDDKDANDK